MLKNWFNFHWNTLAFLFIEIHRHVPVKSVQEGEVFMLKEIAARIVTTLSQNSTSIVKNQLPYYPQLQVRYSSSCLRIFLVMLWIMLKFSLKKAYLKIWNQKTKHDSYWARPKAMVLPKYSMSKEHLENITSDRACRDFTKIVKNFTTQLRQNWHYFSMNHSFFKKHNLIKIKVP